jgi:hypothetical protein
VGGDARLLLEHRHLDTRKAAQRLSGNGEAEDPGPDHREISGSELSARRLQPTLSEEMRLRT